MALAEAVSVLAFLSPALFKADLGNGAIGNWIGGDPPAGLGATVRNNIGTEEPAPKKHKYKQLIFRITQTS